jgi:hypothetical protein
MTTPTPARQPAQRPRLTDDQLVELMKLVKGADSVELKVSVPASAQRATIQGLPIDPVESEPRQVYFFDTPDLALNRAGLVVRARRRQGGTADTVVKLRPVVPDTLPAEVRKDPAFNVEVDALPGGFVCSASFKGRATNKQVNDAVAGSRPLSKVFSKAQRAFYREHAPAGIELDALTPLGPTFLLKGRFNAHTSVDPKAPDRLMIAEMWLYPDGSRILELSTKCRPKEALGVAAECRIYLADRGVPIAAVQQTKTKAALQFYAAQLAGAGKKPARKRPAAPRRKAGPAKQAPAGR